MKPSGIALGLTQDGIPRMYVTQSSHVEDAIWGAVGDAIRDGWSPERFVNEVRAAWAQELRDITRRADAEFIKMTRTKVGGE